MAGKFFILDGTDIGNFEGISGFFVLNFNLALFCKKLNSTGSGGTKYAVAALGFGLDNGIGSVCVIGFENSCADEDALNGSTFFS